VLLESIQDLESESKTIHSNISDYEKESGEFVEKIAKQYGISANINLSAAFKTRKDELYEQLNEWKDKVFTWSIVLLIVVLCLFAFQFYFNNCDLATLGFDFYLRFLFVTPLAFYVYFCNRQFIFVKNEYSKYAYKQSAALSIEAHSELLRRNFKEEKYVDRILEFSLSVLNKIYDKPYLDDIKLLKLKNQIKDKENSPLFNFKKDKNNQDVK